MLKLYRGKGAEIQSSAPVPLLGNLKIWMPEVEVGAGPGELYAKVVEEAPTSGSGFIVRFTAMPPEMTPYLRSWLA